MTDKKIDASKDSLREVADQIGKYREEVVDNETGMVVYKYRLPADLRAALQHHAKLEHITLRELLTRAAMVYFAFDPSGQKPGSYYELHEPGKPPQRIKIPYWPIPKR